MRDTVPKSRGENEIMLCCDDILIFLCECYLDHGGAAESEDRCSAGHSPKGIKILLCSLTGRSWWPRKTRGRHPGSWDPEWTQGCFAMLGRLPASSSMKLRQDSLLFRIVCRS